MLYSSFATELLAHLCAAEEAGRLAMTIHEMEAGSTDAWTLRDLFESGQLHVKIDIWTDADSLFQHLRSDIHSKITDQSLLVYLAALRQL